MKIIYKSQNSGAMTREGVLAIICGALFTLALILGSRTADKPIPRPATENSNRITADLITTTEEHLDSANVMNEGTEPGNTNGNSTPTILSIIARATNDHNLPAPGILEMRLPPAKKQRVPIPANARWVPTNIGGNRAIGPGVPIAFP